MRPTYGVIGIPTFGTVSTEWALNFHMLGVGLAVYVGYYPVKGKRVDVAKEEICQKAVNDGADWVFLIDDDVMPPPNTLLKMTKMAFGPPYYDIINGVYFSKSEPPMPLMFRGDMKGSYWNWHVGDVVKIDAAGAGCTFIKTKVLKKIEKELGKPWFSVDYNYNPEDPNDFSPPSAGATEDLYFYKKARTCGFQTWCDTSIQCIHEDRKGGRYYGLQPDYPQAIPGSDIKPRGKKMILDIGCGDFTPYFQEGVPVRLDNDEKNKPDIVADWNHIPEPDQKYDIVFASHALEHNPFKRVLNVLREWTRVLKVGGELRLVVPNLQYVGERLYKDEPLTNQDMWLLYSAQKDSGEEDLHKSGFTPNLLRAALEKLGTLDDIKVWTSDGNWTNWKQAPGNFNIIATAKKVKHHKASSIVDDSLKDYSPETTEAPYRKVFKYGDEVFKPPQAGGKVVVPEAKPKKEVKKKANTTRGKQAKKPQKKVEEKK